MRAACHALRERLRDGSGKPFQIVAVARTIFPARFARPQRQRAQLLARKSDWRRHLQLARRLAHCEREGRDISPSDHNLPALCFKCFDRLLQRAARQMRRINLKDAQLNGVLKRLEPRSRVARLLEIPVHQTGQPALERLKCIPC